MQDFGTKADNSPPPGGQLSAAEFNNLATENENAVARSGQTLSGASDTQLAQSLFLHGVKAESFQDSGAANAYVVTPVSGASGVLLPSDYANLGGAVISFKASNANSGASTLNIGQTTGTLLGVKAIRSPGDIAIPSGAIVSGRYVQVVYNPALDAGAGAWELLPWSSGGNLIGTQIFTASGTYTPTTGTRFIIAEGVGGGASGGGSAVTDATRVAAGSGGGNGAYAKGQFTTGFSGAAITIGSGGAAGAAGGNGVAGGATSLGAIFSCPGGIPGVQGLITTPPAVGGASSGPGSAPTGGNIVSCPGGVGLPGLAMLGGHGGAGADSMFGKGGWPPVAVGGRVGVGYGSGSSGSFSPINTGTARSAEAGQPGILIIHEYA